MSNKLTSLTGFGEGDPKPEKGNANWALGGSHAPSRNWGAHKDKTGKNAKAKALASKMDKKYSDSRIGLYTTKKREKEVRSAQSEWSKRYPGKDC